MDDNEMQGLRTKLAETLGEHKMLLDYWKVNQQMRVHVIVCQECKILKPCISMAAIAEDVRKLHSIVESHFTHKGGNAKP